MAVLDELIVTVPPYVEEVEAQLRDEERKKTGRYLAVTAVLLIIGIGLYHTVPKITSKITALVCAPVILLLYLLWLWFASQKRKQQLKIVDLNVESQAKTVLENLNNVNKNEDETVKLTNENVKNYLKKHKLVESNNNNSNCEAKEENSSRKSSENCEILIRTYSIA